MKKIILAVMATTTMIFAGGAVAPIAEPVQAPAPKNFYVGGSVQMILADRTDYLAFDDAFNDVATGLGLQAGYVFYRLGDFSTAVEGRYTYSWADNSLGDTGVLSGFIKPAYDFGPVTGYGLVGYSEVDVDALGSTDGFAWGVGISGDVSSNIEVTLDYTINPDFDHGFDITEFDHEVVTVGINYKF